MRFNEINELVQPHCAPCDIHCVDLLSLFRLQFANHFCLLSTHFIMQIISLHCSWLSTTPITVAGRLQHTKPHLSALKRMHTQANVVSALFVKVTTFQVQRRTYLQVGTHHWHTRQIDCVSVKCWLASQPTQNENKKNMRLQFDYLNSIFVRVNTLKIVHQACAVTVKG